MVSNDPDFACQAADIIGLYLNPSRHAAVFFVDEKTALQVLDRRDRILPLLPGRAERHGFEYQRNGTLSLYAALNFKISQKSMVRPPSVAPARTSLCSSANSSAAMKSDREIHIILDNLSVTIRRRWPHSLSSIPTSPCTSR